jgi:CYTH domain-containing protein
MRTGEDEARSPKYAHIERERRWLVDHALRPPLDGLPFTRIEDRYIDGTHLRLRRMTDSQNGAVALKLTKKYDAADPRARPIVTAYLTEAEYAVFAALPARPLAKSRYKMNEGKKEFSIDCFHGPLDGLELAEIEWPDDAGLRGLEAPSWAVREVSDDPAYQGGALASLGLPKD